MNIQYIVPEDDRTAISRVYEESWKYIMHGEIKNSLARVYPHHVEPKRAI